MVGGLGGHLESQPGGGQHGGGDIGCAAGVHHSNRVLVYGEIPAGPGGVPAGVAGQLQVSVEVAKGAPEGVAEMGGCDD